MRGYEVTVKVRDVPGALDTFEVLAVSHEQAVIDASERFRERYPRWVNHQLDADSDTSELLTRKLLALTGSPTGDHREVDRFALMLEAQRELQVESFGYDPSEPPTDEARIEAIRWNVLALENELHEFLGECGWKPWATSRHVNAEAALGELVDAFHFFMNLLWAVEGGGCLGDAHVLSEVFHGRYHAKRMLNAHRQAAGYDGVTGKCVRCGRALDDAQTTCTTDTCARVNLEEVQG